MSYIQIQITASSVAWFALIIATTSMIFQGISVFRDRKKVKIKLERNIRVIGAQGSYPYKEGVDYISLNIINTGRRRVTIYTAGARLLNGRFVIPVDILKSGQVTLEEGKRHNVLMEEDKINFSEISYFYARDATEQVYKKNIANPIKKIYWLIKRKLQSKK